MAYDRSVADSCAPPPRSGNLVGNETLLHGKPHEIGWRRVSSRSGGIHRGGEHLQHAPGDPGRGRFEWPGLERRSPTSR